MTDPHFDSAIMRGLGDGDEDDDELNLTLEEARTLPDRELRRRVHLIVQDLIGTFGRGGALPPDFPWTPSAMTRVQLLAAVEIHAYWFDHRGRHPYPGADREA